MATGAAVDLAGHGSVGGARGTLEQRWARSGSARKQEHLQWSPSRELAGGEHVTDGDWNAYT